MDPWWPSSLTTRILNTWIDFIVKDKQFDELQSFFFFTNFHFLFFISTKFKNLELLNKDSDLIFF